MAHRSKSVLSNKRLFSNLAYQTSLRTTGQRKEVYYGTKSQDHDGNQYRKENWNRLNMFQLGLGLSSAAVLATLYGNTTDCDESEKTKLFAKYTVNAEENQGKKLTEKEANFRRTQTLDKIFDYFATYRYINKKGKNVNLMSIKDFYNAVTPGSTITHGTGLKSEADYFIVNDDDIESDKMYQKEEIPVPNSILNKIQRNGLLSYTDFCFLMNILDIQMHEQALWSSGTWRG